jgi:hypothetical protein
MSFEHYREEHALDAATLIEAARTQPAEPDEGQPVIPATGEPATSATPEVEREPVDSHK